MGDVVKHFLNPIARPHYHPFWMVRATPNWLRAISAVVACVLTLTSAPPSAVALADPASSPSSISRMPRFSNGSRQILGLPEIPPIFGRIIESWQPTDRPAKGLIIHVQDLHTDAHVQQNLSELVAYLNKQSGIALVAVEGAEGLCNTQLYSDLPQPEITERIARLFRDEGLFSGAEYYAITHPGRVMVWGSEEEGLYREHLDTFQQTTKDTQTIQWIRTLRAALNALPPEKHPKILRTLAHLRAVYEAQSDNEGFRRYFDELKRLAKRARVDLVAFPHLNTLNEVYRLFDRIDMRKVEQDRQQLLAQLKPRLSLKERAQLNHLSNSHPTNEDGDALFLRSLAELARKHKVLRKETLPRALHDYLTYIVLRGRIRQSKLTAELEQLEEAIALASCKTEQDRTLVRLSKRLELLEGLTGLSLSPNRYASFQRHRSELTPDALRSSLLALSKTLSAAGPA
ncbi:MAG: hypothetical protein HYU33_03050, partial [Candidatus Omnitrophica bacterium]|nr:hypothetical protein [Candidatus Omnitrophota bacterium]